jgi:hypothetical protein
MLIKINRGTPIQEAESLCDSCRLSRIVRGRRFDEELVFCEATPMQATRITFKVTSCTDYRDHREPSYPELVEKAWILRPASRQRAAGFIRAADLEPEEAMSLLRDRSERE